MNYVTSPGEVFWGVTLVAITKAVHRCGMPSALFTSRVLKERTLLVQPIAGLMTFAWSTGVLFTLAQEFQSAQLTLIHKRRAERRSLERHGANRGQPGRP